LATASSATRAAGRPARWCSANILKLGQRIGALVGYF
jgi:hypothetical protein